MCDLYGWPRGCVSSSAARFTLAEGENDAKRRSVQVRDEIQELTERGFGQKEIFALFFHRARWRSRLRDECRGEPTPPVKPAN